jgi:WD40 repeat protein
MHVRLLSILFLLVSALLAPGRILAQPTNLLRDPGLESGEAWSLCGEASLVNKRQISSSSAMVYRGDQAARLLYHESRCGRDSYSDPYAEIAQRITVPANATALTVSFWYSRIGDPGLPLSVYLGASYLDQLATENLNGWHLFRTELSASQLENIRGQAVDLRLALVISFANSPVAQAPMPGFYIDEVRVVAASERTTASPRPAGLSSDGTLPITYVDGQLGGIARMNADGSGGIKIYSGRIDRAGTPIWSSRGDRIAALEDWLTPEDSTDVTVNPAQITIVRTITPDGSGEREIYRTAGIPGRIPPVPTPADPEVPALDITIASLDWSPDDSQLVLSLCASNRSFDGETTDPICWLEIIRASDGSEIAEIEPAFRPDWGTNNRILYEEHDNYGDKPDGIYELNPETSPVTETLLVAGTGLPFDPSRYKDKWATWSPDGTSFATVRAIDGYHYDENGDYVFHNAIMLFQRNELVGRMLLIVDHGSSPGWLTWSPDGNYLLYSLFEGNAADIWWLDVRSGATGKLTTNGSSIAADWRLSSAPIVGNKTIYLPMMRRR